MKIPLLYLKILFIFFLDRGEGREKERERNTNVWLPLARPLLGTWPATQACALTGNPTSDHLFHRPELNPLSHTSQGKLLKAFLFFLNPYSRTFCNVFVFCFVLFCFERNIDQLPPVHAWTGAWTCKLVPWPAIEPSVLRLQDNVQPNRPHWPGQHFFFILKPLTHIQHFDYSPLHT